MPFGDDDDGPDSSYSSHERYTHADRGKKEELKRRIAEKFGTQMAAKMQKASLMSKASLKKLKENMFGATDKKTATQEEQEKKDEKGVAAGTKTHMQEEQRQTDTANDRIDPDKLLDQDEQEQKIADEETTAEPG